MTTITSEFTPSGEGLPAWMYESLRQERPPRILILYANELQRQQAFAWMNEHQITSPPERHLTFERLIGILHTDLRLPRLVDDAALSFQGLHAKCVVAAENGKFAHIHTPGVGAWTMTKTERLARLHQELMQLRKPFRWQNEPGVRAFHEIVLDYEQSIGGILPVTQVRHLIEGLNSTEDLPFHLKNIDGILLLNATPDFSEIKQDLFLSLSRFVPIHQLIHPGSFRLGYHGAYLVDQAPCSPDNLPSWLPAHRLWTPENNDWCTPAGLANKTMLTRITVDDRHHVLDAVLTLVEQYRQHYDDEILIIDAAVQSRQRLWSKALQSLGLTWHGANSQLAQQPLFESILKAASLSQGMSAWSFSSLQHAFASSSLALQSDLFDDLQHPTVPHWRPRPDFRVLEELSRQFHVLGGPGALTRWLGVLAQARPNFSERRPEQKQQAFEETQWWLACIAQVWAPLLSPEERHLLNRDVVGCSTNVVLPVGEASLDGLAWLRWLISKGDIKTIASRRAPFDHGLGTFQTLWEGLTNLQDRLHELNLPFPLQGRDFIDVLDHLGQNISLPVRTSSTTNLHIVTPEQALGCRAGLVILAYLDVDSWPMRTSVIPWLDAQAQLELGIFQSDLRVRQGRHHLRHLLNASSYVCIFDSSAEEGGGPSAPLAEWLNDVRRSKAWHSMREAPWFIAKPLHQGESELRRFHWVSRESGHGSWLTPLHTFVVDEETGPRVVRNGHLGADARQQLGLDVHAILPFSDSITHTLSVLDGFESSLYSDRERRQPKIRQLQDGETLSWAHRPHLMSTETITLRPSKASVRVSGIDVPTWPHLGHRGGQSVSVCVDPRPLPPYHQPSLAISHRFGSIGAPLQPEVWSPSRLEAWLQCPRKAWMLQVLRADDDKGVESEDIDNRIRGQLIHDVEAIIMQGHGIPLGGEMTQGIQPLHLGPMGEGTQAWESILHFLANNISWLGRQNAVSVYRTRDLIDATPQEWQEWQSGALELPPRGRLARMLAADLALWSSAPIAIEWMTKIEGQRHLEIPTVVGDDDSAPLSLFGYADRVDVLSLTTTQREYLIASGILGEESYDTPYPLTGQARSAQRLVIIRDLKTVSGPSKENSGLRHLRCLFEDLQLALYARAWEVAHPNDRVVGVGCSEIGEHTVHFVELDCDLEALDASLNIGEITRHFTNQFPAVDHANQPMSSLRRWMAERLIVAQRAAEAAMLGHVNPTPGNHCEYCPVSRSCAASPKHAGEE